MKKVPRIKCNHCVHHSDVGCHREYLMTCSFKTKDKFFDTIKVVAYAVVIIVLFVVMNVIWG